MESNEAFDPDNLSRMGGSLTSTHNCAEGIYGCGALIGVKIEGGRIVVRKIE